MSTVSKKFCVSTLAPHPEQECHQYRRAEHDPRRIAARIPGVHATQNAASDLRRLPYAVHCAVDRPLIHAVPQHHARYPNEWPHDYGGIYLIHEVFAGEQAINSGTRFSHARRGVLTANVHRPGYKKSDERDGHRRSHSTELIRHAQRFMHGRSRGEYRIEKAIEIVQPAE